MAEQSKREDGITPEVGGNPSPCYSTRSYELLDSRPEETVMIGDGR